MLGGEKTRRENKEKVRYSTRSMRWEKADWPGNLGGRFIPDGQDAYLGRA